MSAPLTGGGEGYIGAPARYRATGDHMIRTVSIRNFRCFRSVSIADCRRINVIVGRNASGKTALMEAIALALGTSQELAIRYRAWRSIPTTLTPQTMMNPEMDRLVWNDLFFDFDLSKKISITLVGDKQHSRSLRIRYDAAKGFAPVETPGQPTLIASPIIFEYKKHGVKAHVVRAIPLGTQYFYRGAETETPRDAFFPAHFALDPNEPVKQFTNFSAVRGVNLVVDEIKNEFPFIEGIEVGLRAGISTLFLDIPTSPQKIPVGFVSAGISKILTILLSISTFKGGAVFVDEIENGIYFDRYEAMWRSFYNFCVANDVQLFASTHSDECLGALKRVSEKFQDEIKFLRTVDTDKGKNVEQFEGPTIFGAREIGEVR